LPTFYKKKESTPRKGEKKETRDKEQSPGKQNNPKEAGTRGGKGITKHPPNLHQLYEAYQAISISSYLHSLERRKVLSCLSLTGDMWAMQIAPQQMHARESITGVTSLNSAALSLPIDRDNMSCQNSPKSVIHIHHHSFLNNLQALLLPCLQH
jgi:hypothetical protein